MMMPASCGTPWPSRALIVVWSRASLLPIFGEPALSRLIRLATSEGLAVTVWLTPELRGALTRRPPSQIPVVWRVAELEEMAGAVPTLAGHPEETLLVLPGHSVWDRESFRRARGAKGAPEPYAAYRLPAFQVAAAVARWQEEGPPEGPGALLPCLLRGPEDVRAAESRLVAALAAATQESDGFLARWVDRPLSRCLSPRLAARGVPPNAVTLVGSSLGFLGAFFLAQAGYAAHLLGAWLFLVAVVLDGVDGEVARLSLRESRFGHYLDIITDNLVHVAVFCGIAAGLHREAPDARHLYALALLLVGFGLCALAVFLVLGTGPRAAASPWAERLLAALNSRDFAYLVFLLALADRLAWFLWGAAVGTYVFAGALLWLARKRGGGKPPPAGGGPGSGTPGPHRP